VVHSSELCNSCYSNAANKAGVAENISKGSRQCNVHIMKCYTHISQVTLCLAAAAVLDTLVVNSSHSSCHVILYHNVLCEIYIGIMSVYI
jgi:hypothetical protein